jgi:hypothetical protein
MRSWVLKAWLSGGLALLVAGGSLPALAEEAAYGSAAAEIAEKIAAAYPKVSGRVIGLEGERVLLDLGADQKVAPGLELQVYREGEVFKHPYTGQVLGKLDRDVARIRVLEVQPAFSVAEVIQQAEGTMVQQGDRVRVTSARIVLALPNVDVSDASGANTRSVTRDLTNALIKTGRFEVLNDQRIRAALAEAKVPKPDQLADPAVLHALWKGLRVSAVLVSKLSLMEKSVQWDVQVLSTVRGDTVTLASAEVKGATPRVGVASAGPGASSAGSMGVAAAPRVDQIVLRSQDLAYRGSAMAMGELTGDGTLKVAISDGQGIYIYDLTKTGLKEIWANKGSTSDEIIGLDAADINKNGVAELFVTNYAASGGMGQVQSRSLHSYVLEYRDGKFVKTWEDVSLHFRVMEAPDGSLHLYGQGEGANVPFDGPVRQYVWRDNKYMPGPVVPLPKAFPTIYGFLPVDLDGDGSTKIVVLDHLDHLRVFDKSGTEIFRSSDRYGGSELMIEYDPTRSGPNPLSGIQPVQLMLQGRMYYQDIMGDGKKQLIVPRNTPSTGYIFQTRLYDRGKIVALSWDTLGMQQLWETREMPGFIADYALVDPEGSGDRKLVILVVATNFMGYAGGRTNLVVLDLKRPG